MTDWIPVSVRTPEPDEDGNARWVQVYVKGHRVMPGKWLGEDSRWRVTWGDPDPRWRVEWQSGTDYIDDVELWHEMTEPPG